MQIKITGQAAGEERLIETIEKIEKSIAAINKEMKNLHFLLMGMPHLELVLGTESGEGGEE